MTAANAACQANATNDRSDRHKLLQFNTAIAITDDQSWSSANAKPRPIVDGGPPYSAIGVTELPLLLSALNLPRTPYYNLLPT